MARKTTWESITKAYARRVLRERGFDTEDVKFCMRLAEESTGHMSTRTNGTHTARVTCQGAGEWDVELIADDPEPEPEPVAQAAEPVAQEFTVGDMRESLGPVLSARYVPADLADDTAIPAGSDVSDLAGQDTPQAAQEQPQDGRCRASGGYHKYADVPRYTTSDGALLTLGGYLTCAHCGQLAHYSELSADYREALCKQAGCTFPGNLSESFALYALESYGVEHPHTNARLHAAQLHGSQRFVEGLWELTVIYHGDDPEAGPVYTVGANARTAGPVDL
jgi:hypothetical protein